MAFVAGHLTPKIIGVAQQTATALLQTDKRMKTMDDLPKGEIEDWTLEQLFDYLRVWGLAYHTDTGKWEHLTITGRQPLTPRKVSENGTATGE